MKPALTKLTLLLILSLHSTFSFSQSDSITIQFIGNCGLYLSDGHTNIYTDFPYKSGAHGYMEFDEAELDNIKENSYFIFTHKHWDHYSRKDLKRILKEKGGQKFGVSNISELEQLSTLIDNFDIKAFKTKHTFFGIPFRHYSFLITWHGKRIYLSGDTTNPETIGKMENLDWAFVPYWVLKSAKKQGIEIDAKMFGIYHLHPAQVPSAKKLEGSEDLKPMINPGEIITIKLH